MFAAITNFFLNLVATLIQVVLLPLNLIITNALPSLTEQINQVTNGIAELFKGISWGIGLLPPTLLATLSIIITLEICKYTIWANSKSIVKVWNVLQKIKFW